MTGGTKFKTCLVMLIFLLGIACTAAAGRTIYVDDGEPADFNTIQAAIDDSNDGDTIIVADGTYTGYGNRDIDFLGKAITVRSESGPQNCIIDCEALGRGFYFGQGEDANSILDGFTITNARASVATIFCDGSSPTITNCNISGNWATEVGGIYTGNYSSPRISNCTISDNSGGQAGGISCWEEPMIINCNIIANVSRGGAGGGMWCHNSSTTVANCILRGNSPKQIYATPGRFPSVSYSNVEGGGGGVGGIDKDPNFAFGSDYHLMPDSPCIDAGTNNPPGGLPTQDPDGNARPLDGDGDTNSIADIGVYEFNAQEPSIALSANWMQFSTLEGAGDPEDQNLSIRNCSAGTLAWEVIENCSWLEVNPRNGESIGEIDDISVSIRISGLPAGRHDCELRIAANGATNSARMVVVTLYIRGNVLHVPSEYGNIQSAIDDTIDGDTVLVADGTYRGDGNRDINFFGKAITLRSENGPENCIIDCNGTEAEPHRGFYFHNGEDANSVLDGFTIRNGYDQVAGGGIRCSRSSPTIRNCIITNNRAKYDGGGISCNLGYGVTVDNCIIAENSAQSGGGIDSSFGQGLNDIILTNCTFSANSAEWRGGAIFIGQGSRPSMVNCILWGDSATTYGPEIALEGFWPVAFLYVNFSDVQGGEAAVYDNGYLYWEAGNIDTDPCFADPCNGDYHLKSQAGRWTSASSVEADRNEGRWTRDVVTSLCIDAGDIYSPIGLEPFPNGGRINMGAYGGTAEASKSYFGEPICTTIVAGDINGDCKVNFLDFAYMALHWLRDENQ